MLVILVLLLLPLETAASVPHTCTLALCGGNATCCAYAGGVNRCCPRPDAVCCLDPFYCCPLGTKCMCTNCPGPQCDCSGACARARAIEPTAAPTPSPTLSIENEPPTNPIPLPTPYTTTIDRHHTPLNDTRLWLGAGLMIGVPLIGVVAWKLGKRAYAFWNVRRVHVDAPRV